MAGEVKYKVIRRSIITNRSIAGREYKVYIVTFRAENLPPLSVFIPEEEYSPERERELIIKKIRERMGG